MKKLVLGVFAITCLTFSRGQDTPDSKFPPLPDGPLLNRAPEMSRWTVVTQSEGSTSSDSSTVSTEDEPARVVTFTKTGSTLLQDTGTEQIWYVGETHLQVDGPNSAPYFVDPTSDFYSLDFSKSDFSGMDFISPQTYAGLAPMNGRQCIVFRGQVTPWSLTKMKLFEIDEEKSALQAKQLADKQSGHDSGPFEFKFDDSKYKVPAVVYIDLSTRLPVMMEFGTTKKYTKRYNFLSPPGENLKAPPLVVQALNQRAESMKRLSTPPPPP